MKRVFSSVRPMKLVALLLVAGTACALPPSKTVLSQQSESGSPSATTSDAAPEPLQEALDAMLEAANNRDMERLMGLYAPDFKHDDGLSLAQTEQAIQTLWSGHSELIYDARIDTWESDGSDFVATIVSDTTGVHTTTTGDYKLASQSTVRNRYSPSPDNASQLLLVEQETLTEQTTLTSGNTPPEVTFNIPETVSVGSEFDVEAIVDRPLGDRILLGTAVDEPITAEAYATSPELPLEPLLSGGIFRRADAPDEPGAQWISVMLVDDGGVVIEERRLNVTIGPAN